MLDRPPAVPFYNEHCVPRRSWLIVLIFAREVVEARDHDSVIVQDEDVFMFLVDCILSTALIERHEILLDAVSSTDRGLLSGPEQKRIRGIEPSERFAIISAIRR